MACLGDMTIGTRAPLKLKIYADSTRTSEIDTTGQFQFTIKSTELFSDEILILDETEKEIAFQLILAVSGRWEETTEVVSPHNKPTAIEFSYSPATPANRQGFEFVGSLSSIISAKYDEKTVHRGKILRTSPNCDLQHFEIFIPKNYESKFLPLWFFVLKPNENYSSMLK